MTLSEALAAYERAKDNYRRAKRRALKRKIGSADQAAYAIARREYHRAGEALLRARSEAR